MRAARAAALIAALQVLACDSPTQPDRDNDVASVQVDAPVTELIAGSTAPFNAVVRNRNGDPVPGRAVQWSSSDTAVATVSAAGLVNARAAGTARIRARLGGLSDSVNITVRAARAAVNAVVITPGIDALLAPGSQLQFTAQALAANDSVLSDRAITWISTQPAVAIVSASGAVTAHAPGTTRVIATSESKADTVLVTVRAALATRIDIISGGVMTMYPGDERPVTIRVYAADGSELTGRSAQWVSANQSIATVSQSGIVAAHEVGNADVTITVDTVTARVAIDVRSRIAHVVMSAADLVLGEGESMPVTATLLDADGNVLHRPITWSSSNPAVASISASGEITAHSRGTAVVRAVSEGQEGRIDVSVSQWDIRSLSAVGDSSLPATLFTRTFTGPDGVERTGPVQAVSGHLKFVTTGVNSGRYQQTFSVWILNDGQAPQAGTLGYQGIWQYDYMTGTIRLTSSSGIVSTASPVTGGDVILQGRLEPAGPELRLAYRR